ncbi:MAG TPA: TM0106 family RecB-like putative nuclease, partial [Gemmataceae bacterium]|nr:TM0106 family RecB-like putative nuclease [Gemmataceae bacterium]
GPRRPAPGHLGPAPDRAAADGRLIAGAAMNPSPTLTDDLLTAYLKCPYKAYRKLRGDVGEPSDYMHLQERAAAEYRVAVRRALLRTVGDATDALDPSNAQGAIRRGVALILDPTLTDTGDSCRLDALFGPTAKASAAGAGYTPALFIPNHAVTTDDRLRLAFGASVLARIQGRRPDSGKIIHGPQFKVSRVGLSTLSERVTDTVGQIRALAASASPPKLALNRHCAQCEYRQTCRAAAVEKDDLSLLRGLSPKDIAGLHRRGIFTVTQYSYTFRAARLKRTPGKPGGKHHHALQALALRERKIYVARRPELPVAGARAYLDVEGLPEVGLYYLIGLTVEDRAGRRHLSWWADRATDEPAIWAAFLEAARELGEEFVLYHYGSYESQFLKAMEERHGGDADVLARLRSRSVNVLSAIHGQVYFPVHGNDLKSVAGSLGFQWSDPGATGLQAIVWRSDWEATGHPAVKDRLLTYNREDCAALEVVATAVRTLGADPPPASAGTGPPVAEMDEIERAAYRKYGQTQFALPEFAGITKCAYFDYQRDKVLCRTNPDHLQGQLFLDNAPMKVGGLHQITGKKRRGNLVRHLGNAAKRTKFGAGLLVLDGDADRFEDEDGPFCPVKVARVLGERAAAAGAGKTFSLATVFLRQEYESLLIRVADQLPDLKQGLTLPSEPEEAPRDAKGWLHESLVDGYNPTDRQLELTRAIRDWAPVYELRCFRRLQHALGELAAAVATDQHVVSPRAVTN